MAYEIDETFSCYDEYGDIFNIERQVFVNRTTAKDGTQLIAEGTTRYRTDDGLHVTKQDDDHYVITSSGINLTRIQL